MELKKTKRDELAASMCHKSLQDTLMMLRDAKPEERSELARRYAVTITELEKVLSYFIVYVVDGEV